MTTGYKINHASDNAAGLSISNSWVTQLSSLDIAADNAATGADMLTTAEETYSLLTSHLQRIRDLTEQAANGTYGSQSLKAIQSEVVARLEEVSRIANNSEFNGIKLMAFDTAADADNSDVGMTEAGVNLQVGLYSNEDSVINLKIDLFKNATVSGLFSGMDGLDAILQAANNGTAVDNINSDNGIQAFAAACSGLVYSADDGSLSLQTDADYGASSMLDYLDSAINEISDRVTQIGAAQNRVSSAISALDVQSENLTSSLSTLRDTDVAEESSNYLQAQILQQASATLLSTANQLPSIALNLI
jgi:flagellin